jgi:CelD/BcsL family acetyltransferase involved in cellulose biosynthesis
MLRQGLNEVPISDTAWFNFVCDQREATAFHHPTWAEFVSECYGYRGRALLLADDDGRVRAGLPLLDVRRPGLGDRSVSLPFTDYCPPLARGEPDLQVLAGALADWQSAVRRNVHIRAPVPSVGGWCADSTSAVAHQLSLSANPQEVYRRFKKTQVQQCIVKAERAGVTVRRGESVADMRTYYELHVETRRRLGAPTQPWRFFNLLWQRVLDGGLGFVLLASYQDVCVAGAVFLAWNGTLLYKFSASDHRYWQLRPNNLVLWTAIRWACENGLREMDFGRTESDNSGLRAFKKGWGAVEVPLVYSTIPAGNSHGRAVSVGAERAQRILASVIRSSPSWVCRAAGALLYRYAG